MKLKDVKERLSNSFSIRELKEGNREQVWRFLKAIGLQGTWIRSILRREGLRSNQYALATKWWLLEKGFICEEAKGRKKILKLTEKGEDAFLWLDSYYSPSNDERLMILINLGREKQAKVTVEVKSSKEKGGLNASERVSALTHARLFKRLLGFATFFAINADEDFKADELCIKVEPGEIDSDVLLLLVSLWEKYSEIVQEGRLKKVELLEGFYDSLRLTHLSSIELYPYWKYWRKVEEEVRCKIEKGEEVNFDFLRFPRDVVEKDSVRSWIEKRLEEDPDWFMPHLIWVQLGFEQRKNIDRPSVANPPYFAAIGGFYEMAGALKTHLDHAYRIKMGEEEGPFVMHKILKEHGMTPDNVQVAYTFLALRLLDHQRQSEFYEAWKILRKEYTELLPDISRILDAALLRYVYAGKKPDVDLESVFEDLILRRYSPIEIANNVKNGFYKLEPSDKKIDEIAQYEKMINEARLDLSQLKKKGYVLEK
jgi:predicted transcriptional regulator